MMLKLKNANFAKHKSLILPSNIDINKIIVSNKISFGKKNRKYFYGCDDAKKIRSSCIFLPKMSAYNKTKCISFFDKKMMNYQKKIKKFRKKSAIASKKNLIVNLHIMINI